MFKTIMALMLLISSNFVFAEDVVCSVSVNTEVVAKVELTVAPKTKETYVVADFYKFFISNKGDGAFELEVYDGSAPSRSYATGYLRTAKDDLSWTLWSREILLETTCKLAH